MLCVYEKQTDGSSQIMSKILTIDTSINAGSEVTIRSDSTGGTRRTNPAVAYAPGAGEDPALFLVVWQEGWHGMGTYVTTNNAPTAEDQSLSMCANTSKDIMLQASDPDGDP